MPLYVFREGRRDPLEFAFEAGLRSVDLDELSKITGVDKELVKAAALEYASADAAMSFHGLGVTEHEQGAKTVMFIANLRGSVGRFYETYTSFGAECDTARLARTATSVEWFRPNPPLDGVRWCIRKKNFAHVLVVDGGWPPAYARAVGAPGPLCALTFRTPEPELYRELAAARPGAFRPHLAGALNSLSISLAELGRQEEALAATNEAATLSQES